MRAGRRSFHGTTGPITTLRRLETSERSLQADVRSHIYYGEMQCRDLVYLEPRPCHLPWRLRPRPWPSRYTGMRASVAAAWEMPRALAWEMHRALVASAAQPLSVAPRRTPTSPDAAINNSLAVAAVSNSLPVVAARNLPRARWLRASLRRTVPVDSTAANSATAIATGVLAAG